MTVRAVLFDVGGPIDTEVQHEILVETYLRRALLAVGVAASQEAVQAASEWAVQSFAPNTYQAMVWKLCRADAARAAEAHRLLRESSSERRVSRGGLELRPGIDGVVRALAGEGLLLGLAANQPKEVVDDLDRLGLGEFFAHREVSDHHGYQKPDTRLFLRACDDLGVAPEECVMVGDRIDNDIFPARVLGMATVLFRTGRHINQQPRSLLEVPDEEVGTAAELLPAIHRLAARGGDR